MGIDAYAIDDKGQRLKIAYSSDCSQRLLVSLSYRAAFQKTARKIATELGWVCADVSVGGLGHSAHASAANHLLYTAGTPLGGDGTYTPAQVCTVATRIRNGRIKVPAHIGGDREALAHAKKFICVCAKLKLGIEISP